MLEKDNGTEKKIKFIIDSTELDVFSSIEVFFSVHERNPAPDVAFDVDSVAAKRNPVYGIKKSVRNLF